MCMEIAHVIWMSAYEKTGTPADFSAEIPVIYYLIGFGSHVCCKTTFINTEYATTVVPINNNVMLVCPPR